FLSSAIALHHLFRRLVIGIRRSRHPCARPPARNNIAKQSARSPCLARENSASAGGVPRRPSRRQRAASPEFSRAATGPAVDGAGGIVTLGPDHRAARG